jgi:hypothetical protein
MATRAERVAAHRARRHKNLVQRTVTIAESDLNEIAGAGYPEVKSEDKVRAARRSASSSVTPLHASTSKSDSATPTPERRCRPPLRSSTTSRRTE